jgi:heat shock protein HslJ
MKLFYLYLLICASLVYSCTTSNTTRKTVTIQNEDISLAKDSIEYYETDFEIRQKNYRERLIGIWTIDTMHRQSKMNAEYLTHMYLTFSDSTFSGNAGCNKISGRYTLKGTSIKFSDVISTKMACDRLEQEYAFLDLLQNTVSMYTVTDKVLWLRDGASNVVFHASKRMN